MRIAFMSYRHLFVQPLECEPRAGRDSRGRNHKGAIRDVDGLFY
jgi:hypothetical protein